MLSKAAEFLADTISILNTRVMDPTRVLSVLTGLCMPGTERASSNIFAAEARAVSAPPLSKEDALTATAMLAALRACSCGLVSSLATVLNVVSDVSPRGYARLARLMAVSAIDGADDSVDELNNDDGVDVLQILESVQRLVGQTTDVQALASLTGMVVEAAKNDKVNVLQILESVQRLVGQTTNVQALASLTGMVVGAAVGDDGDENCVIKLLGWLQDTIGGTHGADGLVKLVRVMEGAAGGLADAMGKLKTLTQAIDSSDPLGLSKLLNQMLKDKKHTPFLTRLKRVHVAANRPNARNLAKLMKQQTASTQSLSAFCKTLQKKTAQNEKEKEEKSGRAGYPVARKRGSVAADSPFKCTCDQKPFGSLQSLKTHVQKAKAKDPECDCVVSDAAIAARPYECAVCGNGFGEKRNRNNHESKCSSDGGGAAAAVL